MIRFTKFFTFGIGLVSISQVPSSKVSNRHLVQFQPFHIAYPRTQPNMFLLNHGRSRFAGPRDSEAVHFHIWDASSQWLRTFLSHRPRSGILIFIFYFFIGKKIKIKKLTNCRPPHVTGTRKQCKNQTKNGFYLANTRDGFIILVGPMALKIPLKYLDKDGLNC